MASRSTLGADQHTIPLFYSCYLLRSVKTKSSRSTYVGSTPNPPRRIRQHNGELTQGAYKTRRGRPWVMTMIVHGFPSKLAALQFEWAWQHPYMSRHLRVSQRKQGQEVYSQIFKRDSKANLLKTKILVARTMLPIPPYNTWPLHVKIFTEEAKQIWDEVQDIETTEPLPKGLTISVEFEGVDGKSTIPISQRSGARAGPIDVQDTAFNTSHIHKYQSLVNEGAYKECSVCNSEINARHMDHLRVALCPEGDCTAISHLDCLSQVFLKHPSNPHGVIPRGGVCKVCDQYTLWGDVIRGCYRRARSGQQQPTTEPESEDEESEDNNPLRDDLSRHLKNLEIGGSPRTTTKAPTVRVTATRKNNSTTARVAKRGAQKARQVDSEVEDFAAEMDAIECDTDDSEPGPSRKNRGAATSGQHASKTAEAGVTRANSDKPRDMDEIVCQALGNLSISAPSESHQVLPTKSPKAKPSTAPRKPQKSAKARSRVEVAGEERSRIIDIEGKRLTTSSRALKLKSKARKTPSPEFIDIEGI